MKRFVALCGALALTLAMAAPAAANQKVWIPEFSGEGNWGPVKVSLEPGEEWAFFNDWACTDPIWYYAEWKDDLWLWYPNKVAEADRYPDEKAWPWVKGMRKHRGLDVFSANQAMTKKVVSSKLRLSARLYDHDIESNPETWQEQVSGKNWALSVPGMGTVFHETGNMRYTVEVQLPGKEYSEKDYVFHGKMEYYPEKLCEYFDAGPVVN